MQKRIITIGMICLFIFSAGCKTTPPEQTQEPVIVKTDIPTPPPTPVPSPEPTGDKPYYIEVLPLAIEKDYKINPYSFIHTFYSTMFYYFNITGIIPPDERGYIMKKIYDEIQLGSQVNFVIKKYLNVDKLSFVFFILSDIYGDTLHLKTNYDEGAGTFIPLDMPKEEWSRCFSVYYHLINTNLVHERNLYSYEKEERFKKNRQFPDLADLYIFDEIGENDSQVEEILSPIIAANSGNETGLSAILGLIYFYLHNGKIRDAESAIKQAIVLLNDKKETLQWKYMLVEEELQILKDFPE